MAENGHKADFPTRDDIRDFLKTLKPDAPTMFKALDGVSQGAVDKWYRDTVKGGNEISATNLLRVVLSLDKVAAFASWLSGYSPVGETGHVGAAPSEEKTAQLQKELRDVTRGGKRPPRTG